MADVNVGAAANDGTGDPLRSAFIKLNANDQDLRKQIAAFEAGMRIVGDWNPATGAFPATPAPIEGGDQWNVTGSGTIDGVSFAPGDIITAITASPSSTTYAGNWSKRNGTATAADQITIQGTAATVQDFIQAANLSDRSQAMATDIHPDIQYLTVGGLRYARDPAGTALTTADGATWAQIDRKNNFTTSRAPLPSDDETQGYSAGSRWLWRGQEWVFDTVNGWLDPSQLISGSLTSYAAASSVTTMPHQGRVSARIGGRLVEWVRNPAGPCLGGGWSPAGDLTPEHFGAVGDGVANDRAAFQSAIDALPATGGEIVLSKPNYAIGGELVTGGRKILWKGGARINNSVYPSIPGIFESYDPANARRVVSRVGAGNAEFVQQDYYRTTGYGAAPDGVDMLLRAFTTINAGSSTSGPEPRGEWPFLARVDNYSDNINGVANTGQARRYGKGAVWAGHFNCIDNIDPTTSQFAAWGIEVNIQGDGNDPGMLRRVGAFLAHSTSGNYATPGANVIGRGILVQPDSADYNYGVHIMTGAGAGVSKGEFRSAALRIDAKAPDLIVARNPVGTGIMRVGTGLNSGVAAQVVGIGNNASALPAIYSEIRTTISSNTAGSENGVLGLFVSSSGVMDQMIQLSPVGGIQMKIGGSLKQVSQGGADSGGVGFRVLRVPN